MARMQSLNLSGAAKKSDGAIKSLLWPTVDNAWDVDYLGQQGFWICFIIATINLVFTAVIASLSPLPAERAVTLIGGAVESLIFFVGGIGVRQASSSAAITVFALFVAEQLAAGHVSVIAIIIGAVLLSNVRATVLASRWKPASEEEDRPTRFNETLRDKIVDQLPPRAWPILKYPFYILTAIVLLLMLTGLTLRLIHGSSQIPNENDAPSAVVTSPDST